MNEFELLVELHKHNQRQGPGSPQITQKAIELTGLNDRITPVLAPMDNLPFADKIFDLIWSEGAIYIIGFEKGVSLWKRHLKDGGILAVSDITWTTDSRPAALEQFWERECPGIGTVSVKLRALENQGFKELDHFILPEDCWIDSDKSEFEMYMKYRQYYSYGFYIAQKL